MAGLDNRQLKIRAAPVGHRLHLKALPFSQENSGRRPTPWCRGTTQQSLTQQSLTQQSFTQQSFEERNMKTKIAHLPPKRLASTTVSPDHRVGLLAQSPGRPRPNLIGAGASWVPLAPEVSGNRRPWPPGCSWVRRYNRGRAWHGHVACLVTRSPAASPVDRHCR
jgi:hypothetical protein